MSVQTGFTVHVHVWISIRCNASIKLIVFRFILEHNTRQNLPFRNVDDIYCYFQDFTWTHQTIINLIDVLLCVHLINMREHTIVPVVKQSKMPGWKVSGRWFEPLRRYIISFWIFRSFPAPESLTKPIRMKSSIALTQSNRCIEKDGGGSCDRRIALRNPLYNFKKFWRKSRPFEKKKVWTFQSFTITFQFL